MRRAVAGSVILVVSLLAAVAGSTPAVSAPGVTALDAVSADRFGPSLGPVASLVGADLRASAVVALPCIPSRRDPVGVWIGIAVHQAEWVGDDFVFEIEQTEARLGSHPSGCRDPHVLLAGSVFLFDGANARFAAAISGAGDAESDAVGAGRVVLRFEDAASEGKPLDLVMVPTIGYERKNGLRQTTVFGLVGRWSALR